MLPPQRHPGAERQRAARHGTSTEPRGTKVETARFPFAARLRDHQRLGTGRDAWLDSKGYKHPRGKPWDPKLFADACGVTGRSERAWRTGEKLPENTDTIERVLFGSTDAKAERKELRDALHLDREQRREAARPSPLAAPNIKDPPRCVGRTDIIEDLVAALVPSPGGGLALVFGGPGFGKTTVTEKVALHLDIQTRFGARRWFVELEGVEAVSGIIAQIATSIGLDPTAGKEAVFARFAGKPALLVLDNLETPWHADRHGTEALLRELSAEASLALIASLRSDEPPAGLRWDAATRLEPLEPSTARALFLDIARTIRKSDPDLDFLLDRAAGIPLAIFLIATCVGAQDRLAEMRRDWERSGPAVVTEPGGKGSRQGDLVACIRFSLSRPVLESAGRRLFALLGQLPAGIGRDDRDALLGDDASFAPRQLRLVGLLRERDGRLDLLPPIREVARLGPPVTADQQGWIAHYLALARDQGEHVGKEGGAQAVARLQDELPNIGAALLQAANEATGRAEAMAVLSGLSQAMRYVGATADPVLEALALSCAGEADWRGEAACLVAQAGTARMRSDNDKAIRLFKKAQARLRLVPDDTLEAECLWGLAEIALMQDRYDEARDLYQQAQEKHVRAGSLTGEADCLWGLAEIARMQYRHEEARDLFKQAQEKYVRAGSLTGEADCLWGLAEIARMQDHHEEARDLYKQAQEKYVRAGDLTGEAHCISGLASIARTQDRHEEAHDLYTQARETYVRAGDLTGEAYCLWGLAEIARMQYRHEVARDLYKQAQEKHVRAGSLTGEAQCLWGLAEIARMQYRHEVARDLYKQAQEKYVRAGVLTGEAKCLWGLAEIARMQDHHEEARDLYEQAREILIRVGSLIGEAQCLSGLAEIGEATGDKETACRRYAEAEALFLRTPRANWVQWIRGKRRELGCPE